MYAIIHFFRFTRKKTRIFDTDFRPINVFVCSVFLKINSAYQNIPFVLTLAFNCITQLLSKMYWVIHVLLSFIISVLCYNITSEEVSKNKQYMYSPTNKRFTLFPKILKTRLGTLSLIRNATTVKVLLNSCIGTRLENKSQLFIKSQIWLFLGIYK